MYFSYATQGQAKFLYLRSFNDNSIFFQKSFRNLEHFLPNKKSILPINVNQKYNNKNIKLKCVDYMDERVRQNFHICFLFQKNINEFNTNLFFSNSILISRSQLPNAQSLQQSISLYQLLFNVNLSQRIISLFVASLLDEVKLITVLTSYDYLIGSR